MAVGDRAITRVHLWGLTCLVLIVSGCRRDVIGRRPLSTSDKHNAIIVQHTLQQFKISDSPNHYLRTASTTLEYVLAHNKLSKADSITNKRRSTHSAGITWPNRNIILRSDQFTTGINQLAYILVHELAHFNGANEQEALETEDEFFRLTGLQRTGVRSL